MPIGEYERAWYVPCSELESFRGGFCRYSHNQLEKRHGSFLACLSGFDAREERRESDHQATSKVCRSDVRVVVGVSCTAASDRSN